MSKDETIRVKKEIMEGLYSYFESKLTHPHGVDEYETHKEQTGETDDGRPIIKSERVHITHTHMPNIRDSHEHRWFHLLGKLLKKHDYKVIEQQVLG